MRRIIQWLAPPAALLILIGVILFSSVSMKAKMQQPPPKKEIDAARAEVSVLKVDSESYEAIITGLGESSPHYSLTLTAEVSGLVKQLGNNFESGSILKKGDTLLLLDDTEYAAAVAKAESDLAESELALLEEERQAAQAEAEWKASGLEGEPDSELVLHQPQLAAAHAAVKNAKTALDLARNNLQKTTVTAPFDCLVVARQAVPGSYLQAGSEIASLYSTDRVEIGIALSAAEWDNLPAAGELYGRPATITSVENGHTWSGMINRIEYHLDTTSRQRTIIVEVARPLEQSEPLLAGTFVQAKIAGKTVSNLWKLPGSSLSQRGKSGT